LARLAVENLSVGYGSAEVVRDVNFSIASQETLCLMGRNGAGKSTLLKGIVGLLRPRQGSIAIDDCDVTGWSPHRLPRLGLSYAPQDEFLFADFTVRENLLLAHLGSPKFSTCCDRVFSLFPVLGERLSQPAGTLSGGEQKMLAIGRALLNFPSIFLLDEVSEGLSPAVLEKIEAALRQVQQETPLTILIVEQNISFGLRTASRYAVMNRGSVVSTGDVEPNRISALQREVADHLTF
jgi:ABC-type branched-subunit amino acid transport system ATPase component